MPALSEFLSTCKACGLDAIATEALLSSATVHNTAYSTYYMRGFVIVLANGLVYIGCLGHGLVYIGGAARAGTG
jgi:hypothetical protein